jgi:hypothetical protein
MSVFLSNLVSGKVENPGAVPRFGTPVGTVWFAWVTGTDPPIRVRVAWLEW